MSRTTTLDGTDWRCKGYLGADAAHRAVAGGRTDGPGWLPARVPGSVVDDLWRAGEIADPYAARNSLAAEWASERAWLYRRTFAAPGIGAGEWSALRFGGVDHGATVYVDGREVARHEGMFVPFDVPLPSGIAPGQHELAVVIEPAPDSEPQLGRTSRVRIHKSRMSYGWDFCPRLVHQGVWQSVELVTRGPAWLEDVWARPRLSDDLATGGVDITIRVGGRAGGGRLEALLSDGDRTLGTATVAAGGEVGLAITVDAPRPWWPNGSGDAAVHRLRVRLLNEDGVPLDERVVPVGFRRIELRANEGAPGEARGYTFVVNGRPVYANGWNWVPIDVLHGVPRPDRLEHLVRLARDAGVNLFRVWGGGLIESEAFYDACDAAGIMVWQEFSLSSSGIDSTPAADRSFVDLLAGEAAAIVPLRRNHPSLAVWCGGNELEDELGPLDERHPALAALRDVVARLDPDRGWLPTSPTGPRFHNRLDVIEASPDDLHDVHGPWEHQGLRGQQALYDRGTSLFNSEFGVEGMAGLRQVEAIVPADRRWPADRSNPVYRHLGDWWINEPLVREAFGGRVGDLPTLVRASRHLQADGLRYALEANRRRWPRNSGSIPWQFNESYPNAWCTAAVDHRGDPKPAYHAVARAYRPLQVTAAYERLAWDGAEAFNATVWAGWFGPERIEGRLAATVRALDGSVTAAIEADVVLDPAAAPRPVETIRSAFPGPLFVLDLDLLSGADRRVGNRYLFSATADLAPLLDLEPARLDVRRRTVHGERWDLELEHRGGPAAIGLVIEDGRPYTAPGWAAPSDSWFDLLPGECRTISVRWTAAPSAGRRLRIDGWNVEAVDVG